jgi:hypothetical protein
LGREESAENGPGEAARAKRERKESLGFEGVSEFERVRDCCDGKEETERAIEVKERAKET